MSCRKETDIKPVGRLGGIACLSNYLTLATTPGYPRPSTDMYGLVMSQAHALPRRTPTTITSAHQPRLPSRPACDYHVPTRLARGKPGLQYRYVQYDCPRQLPLEAILITSLDFGDIRRPQLLYKKLYVLLSEDLRSLFLVGNSPYKF